MINIVCDRCGKEEKGIKLENVYDYQRCALVLLPNGNIQRKDCKLLCKKCSMVFDNIKKEHEMKLLAFLDEDLTGKNKEEEDDVSEDEEF